MKRALVFQGGWDGHEPQLVSKRFASMLEEEGLSESEVRENLKIHPYFARTFFPNTAKHDVSKLKAALKRILKADIALKSDGSDKSAALEKIIIFVCQK